MYDNFAKVVYWDRSYRIVRKHMVEAIQQNMLDNKPFRMHHICGVDLVQPKTIALITKPSYGEVPPDYDKPQLASGAKKDNPVIPEKIRNIIRKSIGKPKEEREWWSKQFKIAVKKWKENGIIEVPDKYFKEDENG